MIEQATQATKKGSGSRVARHRTKVVARGLQRVEVTVPARDAKLVKAVAGALRAGGAEAKRARDALMPVTPVRPARSWWRSSSPRRSPAKTWSLSAIAPPAG